MQENKQQQTYLLQLYYSEKNVNEIMEELEKKEVVVQELQERKEAIDEKVAQKQKEYKKVMKEVHILENKTAEKVSLYGVGGNHMRDFFNFEYELQTHIAHTKKNLHLRCDVKHHFTTF